MEIASYCKHTQRANHVHVVGCLVELITTQAKPNRRNLAIQYNFRTPGVSPETFTYAYVLCSPGTNTPLSLGPIYPRSSASRFLFISRETLCCAASCFANSAGTFDMGLFEISAKTLMG